VINDVTSGTADEQWGATGDGGPEGERDRRELSSAIGISATPERERPTLKERSVGTAGPQARPPWPPRCEMGERSCASRDHERELATTQPEQRSLGTRGQRAATASEPAEPPSSPTGERSRAQDRDRDLRDLATTHLEERGRGRQVNRPGPRARPPSTPRSAAIGERSWPPRDLEPGLRDLGTTQRKQRSERRRGAAIGIKRRASESSRRSSRWHLAARASTGGASCRRHLIGRPSTSPPLLVLTTTNSLGRRTRPWRVRTPCGSPLRESTTPGSSTPSTDLSGPPLARTPSRPERRRTGARTRGQPHRAGIDMRTPSTAATAGHVLRDTVGDSKHPAHRCPPPTSPGTSALVERREHGHLESIRRPASSRRPRSRWRAVARS